MLAGCTNLRLSGSSNLSVAPSGSVDTLIVILLMLFVAACRSVAVTSVTPGSVMNVCFINRFFVSMQNSDLTTPLPLDEAIQIGGKAVQNSLDLSLFSFYVNEKNILIMFFSPRTSLLFAAAIT